MTRLIKVALLISIFALGLAVRLYDLTDQPIDFHPTRQLRGALIARGLYYRMLPNADPETRETAIGLANTTGQYELPILEKIVAYTYLLTGGERLWISRLYTILFWIIGGVALFDLARMMSSFWAALITLGYYLILPFGVQASRSFQPDPGMVMWLILSTYWLYRWSERQTWGRAILAGVLGGIAILTKVVAGYILAAVSVALVLQVFGFRRFWRSLQAWSIAALMLLPSFLYYLGRGGRASEYFSFWTISLSHLLIEPSFYVRWLNLVQNLMGLTALLLAMLGVLISAPRYRPLLLGLWIGYALYGLFLPYQMYTHSYYHLQLVPIIALSLALFAEPVIERLTRQTRLWQAGAVGVLLVGVVFSAWTSIAEFKKDNYRNEPAYWQEIATHLPRDGKTIALTQDYGYRLEYYGWRRVLIWPNRGDLSLAELRGVSKEFEDLFTRLTQDKSYFLITAFGQLNDQPDLKLYLEEHYPVLIQGSGYIIYDLLHPLK